MTDDEIQEASKPKPPSYCPVCGCVDRAKFPVPIGLKLVGCDDCKTTWPREVFMNLTVTTDPAIDRFTTR